MCYLSSRGLFLLPRDITPRSPAMCCGFQTRQQTQTEQRDVVKPLGWRWGRPLWDIPHGLFPNRRGLKVELVFPPRGWRVLMGKREPVPGLLGDPQCGQTAFPRVVFNLIVTHVTFSLFLSSFSSGADISRMPRPHTGPASLTVPCQRGTIEDLTLTLRHYSKSLVYLQVPCWCCEFYEFG